MAQVFSADARTTSGSIPANNGVVTSGPQTVPLTPPFENFKAKVLAALLVDVAADNTSVTIVIVRNPASEAVTVATAACDFTAAGFTTFPFTVAGIDPVPDGRDVTYVAKVTVAGGAGNGAIAAGSFIEAMLLSG